MINNKNYKRNILSFFVVFSYLTYFFTTTVSAITINPPAFTVLQSAQPSTLYFNDDTGFRDAEITPWSLENHRLGGDYLYLTTSYNTHLCNDGVNLFSSTSYKRIANCKLRQSSWITPTNLTHTPINNVWGRDYYGAFSGHFINTTNLGLQIYLFNHGELLNNNYFSALPENCIQAPDLGYGTLPCIPENTGKSYNAFVGMSTFPWNLASLNSDNLFTDSGPIVWPANGYVENGQKATFLGILHPSSIIKDNFVYVFFRDTSLGTVSGRTAGLKVARAPITSTGIDPLSFKTYYRGFTENALPAGFNKDQVSNFFSQKGGRSEPLFTNDLNVPYPADVYSFATAKLKGTNLYLGVSQDLRLGITLRLSYDLVGWSNPTVVPGTEFDFYGPNGGNVNFVKQPFMYPRLANADGDSNVEIDPNDFYITGMNASTNPFDSTKQAKVVNTIRLKLTNLPIVKPGDLDNDNDVDIYDYNNLIQFFGSTYTITDFNNLVSNFGK